MPLTRKLACLLILIFSVPLLASGQEVFLADNQAAVKIDQYFTELAKQEKFNGTVLVALGDTVVLKKAYNLPTDVKGLETSVDNQLMIASVAKLFVKLAFLKLEEQGGIKTQRQAEQIYSRFSKRRKDNYPSFGDSHFRLAARAYKPRKAQRRNSGETRRTRQTGETAIRARAQKRFIQTSVIKCCFISSPKRRRAVTKSLSRKTCSSIIQCPTLMSTTTESRKGFPMVSS